MTRLFALFPFFTLGCTGSCNSTDTRGDYLAEQMVDDGCTASSPCNFLAGDGPRVYTCTGRYPDEPTVADELGAPNPYLENGDPTRPHYIIYSDGTGEPDADVNWNDLFPPIANPAMLALQTRGKELGCRRVNLAAYEPPSWGSEEGSARTESDYSCVVSTCEAWVDQAGEIQVRQKLDLPDGA